MQWNSVLFSSAYSSSDKTTSSRAVINKVHWCVAIVVSVYCNTLYPRSKLLTTLHQSSMPKPDIGRESRFLPTLPAFDTPLNGFPSEYCHNFCYEKTRMVWLPDDKKFLRYIYSFRQNTRMCQTDRRGDSHFVPKPRSCRPQDKLVGPRTTRSQVNSPPKRITWNAYGVTVDDDHRR